MSTAPTVIPERVAALDTITLDSGNHCNFSEGHCAMEVVAWLAGLGHTDAPECASPVLRDFTVGLNDRWDTVQRQTLKPFLPRMVGTAGDGQDEARAYLALDWLVRTYAPEWLDVAGLTERARDLRDLPRIVDPASAQSAVPVAHAARQDAAAAWDAAWDAARAAAWDAAWDAARAAARDAAGDAARAAAWDAAWDAARAAAGDAAGDAAWDAARAAAGDAAGDSLAPTVAALQASALDLLDRMIDPGAATA